MTPKPPIFFLHVTKTGGQTIEYLANKRFHFFQFPHDTDFQEIPYGFEFYSGQVGAYTIDRFRWTKPLCFSFVREPIDRLRSFHRYFITNSHHKIGWYRGTRRKPIIEYPILPHKSERMFFEQPGINLVAYNRMTRDFGSPEPLIASAPHAKSRWVLDRARARIEKDFNFIGVFEHFDKDVKRIFREFGSPINELPKKNTNPLPPSECIQDGQELLEEYTYYDKMLYDFVLEQREINK